MTLALANLQAEGNWSKRDSWTPICLMAGFEPLWICRIMKQIQVGSLYLRSSTASQHSWLAVAAFPMANIKHVVTFWNSTAHLLANAISVPSVAKPPQIAMKMKRVAKNLALIFFTILIDLAQILECEYLLDMNVKILELKGETWRLRWYHGIYESVNDGDSYLFTQRSCHPHWWDWLFHAVVLTKPSLGTTFWKWEWVE